MIVIKLLRILVEEMRDYKIWETTGCTWNMFKKISKRENYQNYRRRLIYCKKK